MIKNNIETDVQLDEFINTKETEIEKLCTERKALNSKIYRLPSEQANELKLGRDIISIKITKSRKELKTVHGVVKRKDEIKAELTVITNLVKSKAFLINLKENRMGNSDLPPLI